MDHLVTNFLVLKNIANHIVIETASTTISPHQMAMVVTQMQPQSKTLTKRIELDVMKIS